MTLRTRAYVGLIVVSGVIVVWHSIHLLPSSGSLLTGAYFALTILASLMKARLPGIKGTMSLSSVVVLLAILELNLLETILVGLSGMLVQCYWRAKERPHPEQVLFNLGNIALSIWVTHLLFYSQWLGAWVGSTTLRLVLSSLAYFFINTIAVSFVIALTEGKRMEEIWNEWYLLTFPYFLAGAVLATGIHWMNEYFGHGPLILVFPALLFFYKFFSGYLVRLENERDQARQERSRAEDLARLHFRTLEVLAAAIEGQDDNSNHLERLQLYCLDLGKAWNLPPDELAALQAAALLHDVGNLGISEHILSKPGSLTAEEFDKVKVHPDLGADILERVQFPYPVAPIVRAHHEKWDGSGYPNHLAGNQIPRGARILSVVDSLDALLSSRTYRGSITIEKAVKEICRYSGTSFDPEVINLLLGRYVELEKQLQASYATREQTQASGDLSHTNAKHNGVLSSIAAARHEAQKIFEVTQELGNSLSLEEMLNVTALRLKELVSHDCLVIFMLQDQTLVPIYAGGEDAELFRSLKIPFGEGLTGWVAENERSIVNGNPAVEAGYLHDTRWHTSMQAALVIPLVASGNVTGVLSLYKKQRLGFSNDHVRILASISQKLVNSIENAIRYSRAESSSTIDFLTQLPNARSLFERLNTEIERAHRFGRSLCLLVCDLDGFKAANDNYGHLAGNQLLQEVAKGLRGLCREYDFVARMGGDEFVLLLPEATGEEIDGLSRRMNQIASDAGQKVCQARVLGMSVGMAILGENGDNALELIEYADANMYDAKRRNKDLHRSFTAMDVSRLASTLAEARPSPASEAATSDS